MLKDTNIDSAAKQALAAYHIARRRRSHTSLNRAGVELDVIKCYLQDMTIAQIVKWLEVNKNVAISSSSIGRFCTTLFRLGITPIGTTQAQTRQLQSRIKRT